MILSAVIFLPLVSGLLIALMPPGEQRLIRGLGFGLSLVTFAVSLLLLTDFSGDAWSHAVDIAWIPSLGIHYHVGIDGISLWLILLTTFLTPIVLLASWHSVDRKVREFVAAVLLLQTGVIGAFAALDMFVFYVFWELMLVPMYLIIGIWGGDRRFYASIKFVLYTLVGSLAMLLAIVFLVIKYHGVTQTWSFDYTALSRLVLSPEEQLVCFLAFALAFCIKVPLFPLHTWLPDAHVEAPTAGSVLLAAVLLKLGTYGLLRFAMPFFPTATAQIAPILAVCAVIGVIYGSLVAYAQQDIKKMIAYSSVAHLAVVVLGLTMWNGRAIDGAVYQMLAHGLSTGGLFLAIGILYERRHTRKLDEYGGIADVMPKFAAVFLIFTFASVGLPGLCGFVGEFLVLSGTFSAYHHWSDLPNFFAHPKMLSVLATTGVIFSAVYMLHLCQKMLFGPLENPKNQKLSDLSIREIAVLTPMVIMTFWLGLYPAPFLSVIDPAVKRTMAEFQKKYAAEKERPSSTKLVPSDSDTPVAPPAEPQNPEAAVPSDPSIGAAEAQ